MDDAFARSDDRLGLANRCIPAIGFCFCLREGDKQLGGNFSSDEKDALRNSCNLYVKGFAEYRVIVGPFFLFFLLVPLSARALRTICFMNTREED